MNIESKFCVDNKRPSSNEVSHDPDPYSTVLRGLWTPMGPTLPGHAPDLCTPTGKLTVLLDPSCTWEEREWTYVPLRCSLAPTWPETLTKHWWLMPKTQTMTSMYCNSTISRRFCQIKYSEFKCLLHDRSAGTITRNFQKCQYSVLDSTGWL